MTALQWFLGLLAFCAALFPLNAVSQSKSVLPKGCVDCHGSEPKYAVRGARTQYLTSWRTAARECTTPSTPCSS